MTLRLLHPDGRPTLNRAERQFLRELRRMDPPLETAVQDMNHALLHDNVEAGVRAALRLLSIGEYLAASARELKTEGDAR